MGVPGGQLRPSSPTLQQGIADATARKRQRYSKELPTLQQGIDDSTARNRRCHVKRQNLS
ncbi:MAG: hypothetical protein IJT11_09290 [Bacteroidaceae bacterium]|nr:hypothetical protein [Bacteroidaceae bacterium]